MNFYFEAAKALDKIDAKHGSIKGILSEVEEAHRKRTAAAVIRTLEYKPVLLTIIKDSDLLKHEKKHITSLNLALLLVHDLLFTRGIQAGDGPIKQAILKHKTRLHSELVKAKIKKGVKDNKDLARAQDSRSERIPRYVRVNRNVGTVKDAISNLAKRSLTLSTESGSVPDTKHFVIDSLVPDLLAFDPSTTFHSDRNYLNGLFILQDKASCLSASVLAPPAHKNTVVIDATAAPGNKTSHLSALMGNKGKIFAFERDKRRFKTLEKMLAKARCSNVEATCGDFLEADPSDPRYAKVSHILLDPSCSGSGIVNRLDYLMEDENEQEPEENDRLQRLSEFQLTMILHAMKFPKVERIVYSTCSIHAQENENVVRDALKSAEAAQGNFTLAPRSVVLPSWPRRGIASEMGVYSEAADTLIRTIPGEDRTNGFFVAAFVRRQGPNIELVEVNEMNSSKRKQAESENGDEEEQEGVAKKKKRKRKKKSGSGTVDAQA